MTKQVEVQAKKRDVAGKGAARKDRKNNLIPAVIYGQKKSPVSITLCFNEILKQLNLGGFKQADITINIEGVGTEKVKFKEMQLHPVKHIPQHIDFIRAA